MSNIVSSEIASNSEGFAESVLSRLGPLETTSSTTTTTMTDVPAAAISRSSNVEDSIDPVDSTRTDASQSASYGAPSATYGLSSTAATDDAVTSTSQEAHMVAPRERRQSAVALDHGIDTTTAGTTGTSFLPHADEDPSSGLGETTAGGTYLGPGPSGKGWLGKAGPEEETSDTTTSGENHSSLARDHGIDTVHAGTTGTDFIHHSTTDAHGEVTAGGTNIGPGPSSGGMLGKLEGLLHRKH